MLVDFFRPEEIAERVVAALTNPAHFAPLRERARQTIVDSRQLRSETDLFAGAVEADCADGLTGQTDRPVSTELTKRSVMKNFSAKTPAKKCFAKKGEGQMTLALA